MLWLNFFLGSVDICLELFLIMHLLVATTVEEGGGGGWGVTPGNTQSFAPQHLQILLPKTEIA